MVQLECFDKLLTGLFDRNVIYKLFLAPFLSSTTVCAYDVDLLSLVSIQDEARAATGEAE